MPADPRSGRRRDAGQYPTVNRRRLWVGRSSSSTTAMATYFEKSVGSGVDHEVGDTGSWPNVARTSGQAMAGSPAATHPSAIKPSKRAAHPH
jgi:hypothetical protein